jgi:hypothetical protein
MWIFNSNKSLRNSSIDRVHMRMLLSHFQYKLDEQMEEDIYHVVEYLNV